MSESPSESAFAASTFKETFLKTEPSERFSLILRITNFNNDNMITNLLATLNINDILYKNCNKVDNIYFICQQLRAFTNFKMIGDL
jgi:hypothetical protein